MHICRVVKCSAFSGSAWCSTHNCASKKHNLFLLLFFFEALLGMQRPTLLPSRSSIEDICRAFGISVSAFYNDIDPDKLSSQQIELLTLFEKLPESKRGAVPEIIRSLVG